MQLVSCVSVCAMFVSAEIYISLIVCDLMIFTVLHVQMFMYCRFLILELLPIVPLLGLVILPISPLLIPIAHLLHDAMYCSHHSVL